MRTALLTRNLQRLRRQSFRLRNLRQSLRSHHLSRWPLQLLTIRTRRPYPQIVREQPRPSEPHAAPSRPRRWLNTRYIRISPKQIVG
jgi:hypothetical protein